MNPSVRIERDQLKLVLQLGSRFGLSPSDLAGLAN